MVVRSVVAAALLLAAASAAAHPAPFSYLDLHLDAAGVRGTLVVHDLDAAHDLGVTQAETLLDPAVAATYRDALVALLAPRLRLLFDGADAGIVWGAIEVVPERQSVRLAFTVREPRPGHLAIRAYVFPYDPIHQTFINLFEDGEIRLQAILDATRQDVDYYAGTTQGRLAVVRTFVASGIEHILIGPDHVLFLIGLLLLGGTLTRLALIVTAFTIGHSITLSLAALDLVSPPAHVIEPLIALTIVVVGADNLLVLRAQARNPSARSAALAADSAQRSSAPAAALAADSTQRSSAPSVALAADSTQRSAAPSVALAADSTQRSSAPSVALAADSTQRSSAPAAALGASVADLRPWLAAAFGLIHGFGFAYVLKEFGLPQAALAWSLFAFNVGVEVGQLLIVAVVAGALMALRAWSDGAARMVAVTGSVAVILAGAYWFVERVFLT
jgi:hypothetical protein